MLLLTEKFIHFFHAHHCILYHSQLLHPTSDGHLSCFWFLAIVSETPVSSGVHVYWCICECLSIGSGMLAQGICIYSTLIDNANYYLV